MSAISPILIDFPAEIETGRLILRHPLPGDGAEVNKAMQESMEQLRPWLIWANREQSPEETEIVIRQSHARFLERSDLRFHGYSKETGELAFCGGLHRIDWNARKFEIGYWLRTKYAGQGLAAEAVLALERLAMETLDANRIEIQCDSRNVRSAKVAERLGYKLEGVLRSHQMNATLTELRDTMLFAKVKGFEF